MNRPTKITLIAFTLLLAFVSLAGTASACPTCKDALAGDPAYSSMVNGYFWSIIFMMSMPFLVFSGVAAYFYYEVRRGRARQTAAAKAVIAAAPEAAPDGLAGPEISLQS